MKRLLLFITTAMLLGITPAMADDFGDRLKAFEEQPDAQAANHFFDLLFSEEFTDEHIHYTAATPADTLRKHVSYWAAEYFYDQQQYDLAKSYGSRALQLFKADDNGQEKFDCLNLMAIIHIRLGDSRQAAVYAKQAYQHGLKANDPDRLSSCLNTLAGIYLSANMPEEAEQYVLKGIDYCQKAHNDNRLAILNSMASEIYHALDQQQKALDYATRARDIDQRLGNTARVAVRQALMGAALVGLNRLDEAQQCLKEAIPVLTETGNYHSLAIADNKMGELLLHKDKPEEAVPYYEQAAQIFKAMGDPYNELHSQLGLYNALKTTRPDQAHRHIIRYAMLKDTIYSLQAAQAMARSNAEMGNAELKAQNEQERARAHSRLLWGIAIATALAIVVLVLAWLLHQRTKKFTRQFNELSTDFDQLNEQYEQLRYKHTYEYARQSDDAQAAGQQPAADISPEDRQFLQRLEKIVGRQIEEGHVDVKELASEMCMSITAFRRRFTALIDDKPQAYVMRLRMEKACQMIEAHPEESIANIGLRLGFDDKSNFTRAFKRIVGVTPSEYLKSKTTSPDNAS
ncbi:MAG: tetratricopeptide repeat protein [Prevotella sp.]|nr:tetratricopeptide repeat protein [Prevotella sp.]